MNPSTDSLARGQRDNLVLAIALVSQLALLTWDITTPLGRTEWVFHLLPLTFLLFQSRRWPPALLVVSASMAIWLGFELSARVGMDSSVAAANRLMGVFSVALLGGVVTLVLLQRQQTARLLWEQQGKVALGAGVAGEGSPEQVGSRIASALCSVTGAQLGVVYRIDGDLLCLCGAHAADWGSLPTDMATRTGLLAQVAAGGPVQTIDPAPAGHLSLHSGLGRSDPSTLLLLPLRAEGAIVGVAELGFVGRSEALPLASELCTRASELLGLALRAAIYRQERQALLEESQRQAEELQVQQEELRVNNDELEAQSRLLRESQAALEIGHNALAASNAQLALQAQSLAQQKTALLQAQNDLLQQTESLSAASRYKSEFLANMSHELRTPLNSALILSRLLADNRGGTLTAEQVKYAQAIHDANNDLLALINDILDLAKVEAGHADLRPETVRLTDMLARLRGTFEPMARDKHLQLDFGLSPGAPATITTDSQRLQQVLKNLLANAIKFTRQGRVALQIDRAPGGGLNFAVSDTGLGIDAENHAVIFEAFRQADGSTSRQFGGTGLGLSISRELVHRMGGNIQLKSALGEGSTFTVHLPDTLPVASPAVASALATASALGAVPPMEATLPGPPGAPAATAPEPAAIRNPLPAAAEPANTLPAPSQRRVLMAVEDDARFAAVLQALVQEMGFDCVIATTGEQALAIARQQPLSGILLDVGLPDQSGLAVLERLKNDPATRHVPVHVVSSTERSHAALEMGAVGHAVKPVQREELVAAVRLLEQKLQQTLRRVLVVEDDVRLRDSLCSLLAAPHVELHTAGTMAEALAHLAETTFDCMVTDLVLPDGSGDELLERMAASDAHGFPPVIVYTGRALTRDEELRLRRHSRSIIVKGARSPERLLDEVTLFLHSVEAQLPDDQRRLLSLARERDAVLDGRTVLLAEDDVRNIFALTSVFEQHGVRLVVARNGREAVDAVQQRSDIDLVLMDVMMPEMDGLTAMRHIRAMPAQAALPIIALTAKAMANDRQDCLAAGASDYLAKPIDAQRLLSLCRVWMPK